MRIAINIILLVCCIIAVPYLGLFSTVGIYLAVHMYFLGVRPIPLVGLVAFCSILVMYCFFGLLLGVRLSGTLLV